MSSAVTGKIVTVSRSGAVLPAIKNRENHNLYAFIVTGTITLRISRGHWFVIAYTEAERVITCAAIKRGTQRAYTTTIELRSIVTR